MEADGSGLTTLTHSGHAFEPAWSPDGTRIAFTSLRGGRGQIYSIRADGTGLRRLTKDRYDDGAPDWQPVVSPSS
jgi:TolB protein